MNAIVTKYHGPSNVRGSRITATDNDGNRTIIHYERALNSEGNHIASARALCSKMGWTGTMQGGHLKNGMMVFVWTDWQTTFNV